jgi:hypothetical protein
VSGTFKPRTDILPLAQQQLWPSLKPTVDLGFVLYGGTAAALRLGHRLSVDFDFFCEKPLDRAVLYGALPFLSRSTVLQDERNALSVLGPGNVKLSFFGTIGFGRVGEPELTDDGVLEVASLDDLMATKLKVVLQRAEAKDYRDIAQMINAGISLPKGLASAREMFAPTFQPSESLKALVYYEDGDLSTLTPGEKSALVQAVSGVRDLPPIAILSPRLSASPG